MTEWTQIIRTQEDAEAFFRSMGCSSFHMQREFPERYMEYRSLNIPEGMEVEWRRKEFYAIQTEMLTIRKKRELWSRHAYLSDLARDLEEKTILKELVTATERLVTLVPDSTRILVAETIVGRENAPNHDGLIDLAMSLNAHAEARDLAVLAHGFSDGKSAPPGGPPIGERRAEVLKKLESLSVRFGLK